MSHTQIRPPRRNLLGSDPSLPELMRYITRLPSGDDSERIAHHASLLYLALITGFVENDLLQEAWAPRFAHQHQ